MAIFGLLVIVVFAVIIAIVVTGGWIFVSVIRGIVRMISGKPAAPPARPAMFSSGTCNCPRVDCHTENPVHAQFCRRCGEPLRHMAGYGAQRVA